VVRRLLLLVDGLLVVGAALLAVRLYGAWTARPPSAPPEPAPAVAVEAPAPPEAASARPPLTAYAAVVERNLFSPTRTEAPPEPPRAATGAAATPPAPKPRLYGIVLLPEGRGRAYLEDVLRRRVFAYSVGDLVGDARLEEIKTDRVVFRRGAETFEVLLHDPAKPRPATAPAAVVQSPEAGRAGRPPVVRPPTPAPSPGPGLRPPGRPRVPAPAPTPPPPSSEEQESSEEE
jgi:hypothetical protein